MKFKFFSFILFNIALSASEYWLYNTKLVIEHKSITKSTAKVIVNSANQSLQGQASGVCGAIFRAAGWDNLQKACDQFPLFNDARCPMGNAVITDSFNLKPQGITNIIHAVGPDCRIIRAESKQTQLLHDAYYNSLAIAEEYKLSTISFPFIGSGIYSCPRERAATVAINSIKDYINSHKNTQITTIYFTLYFQRDFDLFVKIAKTILS